MQSFIPRRYVKAGCGIEAGPPYYYDFPDDTRIVRFWSAVTNVIAVLNVEEKKFYFYMISLKSEFEDAVRQLADPRTRLGAVGYLDSDLYRWCGHKLKQQRETTVFILDPDHEDQSQLFLVEGEEPRTSAQCVVPLHTTSLIPVIPKLKERLIKSYKKPLKRLME